MAYMCITKSQRQMTWKDDTLDKHKIMATNLKICLHYTTVNYSKNAKQFGTKLKKSIEDTTWGYVWKSFNYYNLQRLSINKAC